VVLNFLGHLLRAVSHRDASDLAAVQNEFAALGVQVNRRFDRRRALIERKVLQFVRETKVNFSDLAFAAAPRSTWCGLVSAPLCREPSCSIGEGKGREDSSRA
jgi:hypothetical protein